MRNNRSKPELSRRGASTVEFALVLPVLVTLFVIVVDFSRIFRDDLIIANAARTGALYGSDPRLFDHEIYEDETAAALAVAAELSPSPQIVTSYGTDSTGADWVEVEVTHQFESITNFPTMPTNFSVSRRCRMRVKDHSVDGL